MISKDTWTTVIVPRTNLYMLFNNANGFGNELHYEELCEMCRRIFPNNEWDSFVDPDTGEKYFFLNTKNTQLYLD